MTIDLTCPAEIFRIDLPTDALPAATLLLYNLSDRVISSAEVTLLLSGEGEEEQEKVVYRGRALNGRPHSTFPMSVPCTADSAFHSAEAVIDKVWFADNEVWRRNPDSAVTYIPNQLSLSPQLTALKFVAGETAVGFPSQQDGLWVCICGRPNPDTESLCARCRREKNYIFARYNQEAVEAQLSQKERQLELNTRNAREDTSRLQRMREEAYNQKRNTRLRRLRLFGLALLGLGMIAAAVLFGAPGVRLLSANDALRNGRLPEAEEAYRSLGSFGNAREQLDYVRFLTAQKTVQDSEDPETLTAAAEALRGMTGRAEAQDEADEAEKKAAKAWLNAGNWAAAQEAALRMREEAPGRQELLQDCTFAQAQELLDQKAFTQAEALFRELGTYRDADRFAAACVYEPTLQLIEDGSYDEAIEALTAISPYQDTPALIRKCHYLKGMMFEKEGDSVRAAEEYLLAEDWDDAREKAVRMVWDQAEAALAAGDLSKAASLYAAIPDDPQAQEKSWYCLVRMAEKSVKDTEYLRALDLLSGVPDSYEGADALRRKSAYFAAKTALGRGDEESAISLLESAGDYQDARAQLESILVPRAADLLDQGDAAGAEAIIRRLPEGEAREQLESRLADLSSAGDTAEKPAEEASGKPAGDTAENPAKEASGKSAGDAAEKPAEEASGKPAGDTP